MLHHNDIFRPTEKYKVIELQNADIHAKQRWIRVTLCSMKSYLQILHKNFVLQDKGGSLYCAHFFIANLGVTVAHLSYL